MSFKFKTFFWKPLKSHNLILNEQTLLTSIKFVVKIPKHSKPLMENVAQEKYASTFHKYVTKFQ